MKYSFYPLLSDSRWDTVMLLNSNSEDDHWMLALGAKNHISVSVNEKPFETLEAFHSKNKSWLFGHLSYDLKNAVEALDSSGIERLGFPDLHFFEPEILVEHKNGKLHFHLGHDKKKEIENLLVQPFTEIKSQPLTLSARLSKKQYLEAIRKTLEHIQLGDVYEMNFCQELFAEGATLDPVPVYKNLNDATSAPFSSFYKIKNRYLISASPERYLKKTGRKIISQPIKGTTRRGSTSSEDLELKTALHNDPKERSENVMITDLVRNDLSRFAQKGSVKVEELCGIHSFKTVHQMISTVSCEVSEEVGLAKILRSTFPMGSMTGAPKVSAMQLIERYENMKRGLYSGSVGYIKPNGDFDFNVVIRSLQYNAGSKYLSAMVGGAITSGSDPTREYEECMLKAEALRRALD